jgi:hypothetical protein
MYGSSTLGTNATKCGMGGRRMKNPVWARSSSSNVTWGWFDGTFISFGFVCNNFWGDENSSP